MSYEGPENIVHSGPSPEVPKTEQKTISEMKTGDIITNLYGEDDKIFESFSSNGSIVNINVRNVNGTRSKPLSLPYEDMAEAKYDIKVTA